MMKGKVIDQNIVKLNVTLAPVFSIATLLTFFFF